jgi:two-component system CheB/CheR fusion protein
MIGLQAMAEANEKLLEDTVPPIVGIGASAGGLEALIELFAHIPATTGFAFLVVQHLSPIGESLLPEILSKKIALPVSEARQGQAVEPDRVYVVPPNAFMSLGGGRLVLASRADFDSPPMSIDHLFRSLARELGKKAIGVILSGTGADGTLGLKAIKAQGGITVAQDPGSTLFDAMPRHAIEQGGVDFILPPRQIAQELARIGQLSRSPPGGEKRPPASEEDLAEVFQVLRTACLIDFSHYKRSTIQRRLARRLALHKMRNAAEYLAFLRDSPGEALALCQDFLIRVTGFFRDPETFESLEKKIFPHLMEGRFPGDPIRIWVPGCSTGEEVYSIAIALLEFLGERADAVPIQLFGTDLSGPAIEYARAGLYSEAIRQQMSPERLARFFTQVDEGYRITAKVRDRCIFAQHNVARDPPFSKLDLISCCNLLIYFGPALQRRVFATFHYALKPGGFLLLGPSESIGQQNSKLFCLFDKKYKVYERKNQPGHLILDLTYLNESFMSSDSAKAAIGDLPLPNPEPMQGEIDRLILTHYAPAGLVVDEGLNVVQFTGQAGPYLTLQQGPASLNLRRLVEPGLLTAISSAVHEAVAGGAPVRKEGIRHIDANGEEQRRINVDVLPLRDFSGDTRCFLITFEEILPPGNPASLRKSRLADRWSAWLRGKMPAGKNEPGLLRLRQELEATQKHMRAILEAYERAQEELKSSQEELLSAKEEFQSTSEELETAKEELQSANEELVTANEELRIRNLELSRANLNLQEARDYAEAIVQTMRDALLILDRDLRVRRTNRAFHETFKITSEEAENRLFYEMGQGAWNLPELVSLLGKLAADGARIDNYELALELPRIGRRVVLINARRLMGEAELSGLILVSMLDVTERKGYEARLRQQAELLDQAHEAILIWKLGGAIRYWNRGAEELYGWTWEEAMGQMSDDLLGTQRGIGSEEFERRLRDDRQWIGEVVHTTRDGRKLIVDSRYTVSEQPGGALLVFETNRDITERRQAEEQFRALADSIPQLAWMARSDGFIFWYNRRWYEYTGTMPQQVEGWGWQSVHDPEILPRVLERWKAAIAAGEFFEMEYPLRGADGGFRWFLTRTVPVKDAEGRVVRWFGTGTDVSEKREAEQALRRADRQKDEFLAMLAHELRNPLAPLRNALGILRKAGPDQVSMPQLQNMMDRQLTKLSRIVDDLLDIARITRGQIDLRKERVDLASQARHAVESIEPQLKACGHALSLSLPESPVRIEADPVRMEQIIENLLSNAVKYTPPGGHIELGLETGGNEAVLRVRDNGNGISPEALPSIFELFTQGDRTLGREQGGLGIGLTLVRRLVEMHGGRIEAESAGIGRGSRFTVYFPLAETDGEAAEAASESVPAAVAPPALRRILVVDDNQDAADSMALLIGSHGREIEVAYDGSAALELAGRFKPNVVLLDIGLPGMDGYQVAKRLRALPGLEHALLVAVSGYGAETDRRASREAGIDYHLVKPVDFAALERILGKAEPVSGA